MLITQPMSWCGWPRCSEAGIQSASREEGVTGRLMGTRCPSLLRVFFGEGLLSAPGGDRPRTGVYDHIPDALGLPVGIRRYLKRESPRGVDIPHCT
ncbi:hypothetical protein NDU88_004405 [Pleurodeles waltl]|uniref:Uncharacterized protein n=1 Tax=Pleurodeles waltl TaxID=8319 RepID=A0AAV7NJG5_PLEWA|nr:hypothetical protein NDU88_004405 [Pleurodeles waltl]